MGNNVETIVDGLQLLQTIANKEKDLEAAKNAFAIFVSYFESTIIKATEIHASKIGYDENVAFEAAQCAFNKVWLYPSSFDIRKSYCKSSEKAIIVWLIRIAVSQMHQFTQKGVCAKIKIEEDLSIIEKPEDFVNHFNPSSLDPDTKMKCIWALNDKMSKLDEKHRIIYLTYKAYQEAGKKLPRTLLEKLRKRLGITQTTIRVYKREACEILNDYSLINI